MRKGSLTRFPAPVCGAQSPPPQAGPGGGEEVSDEEISQAPTPTPLRDGWASDSGSEASPADGGPAVEASGAPAYPRRVVWSNTNKLLAPRGRLYTVDGVKTVCPPPPVLRQCVRSCTPAAGDHVGCRRLPCDEGSGRAGSGPEGSRSLRPRKGRLCGLQCSTAHAAAAAAATAHCGDPRLAQQAAALRRQPARPGPRVVAVGGGRRRGRVDTA